MNAVNGPIHVFVVAPAMLCWGFEKFVHTACPGIRLTGTAATLAQALELTGRVRVDVMVVDCDEGYGPDAMAQASQDCAVLLLTSSRHDADLEACRRAGVSGAVRKSDAPEVLLKALEEAFRGTVRTPFLGLPMRNQARPAGDPEQIRIASLTARERQLVFAVLCNATAPGKVIADRMCISEHTLRNHLSSIYGKLGVQNRLSLHAFAARHRLDSAPGFLDT
jgi:two-component system, NarL family, nitrate/nitrite response regulator NarL